MIMFGALILVIVITAIFYFIKPKEFTWWEFFIPMVITTGVIFGMKVLIELSSAKFTEYWGETITIIGEEAPYNYWKVETCYRSEPCGTDSKGNTEYCQVPYDCSHQEDEGPSWWAKTNLDNSYSLTEHQHDSIVSLFGTGKRIVDYHHNYSSRSKAVGSNGTKYEGTRVGEQSPIFNTTWNGADPTRKGYFTVHTYVNRVKASDLSLFNISVVNKKQADSIGLYKYPDMREGGWFRGVGDNIYFPTILGKNVPKSAQENFKKLNAKFGHINELRLWVLLFDKKPASVAALQENYWVKGNQNELVICIGTDGNEIKWSHSFSWGLSGDLTAETAQKVLDLYSLTVKTKQNQSLPLAMPISVKMKKLINKFGVDTSFLPPVLPLNINKKDIVDITKSNTPVFTEQTWNEYYEYLNANLNRFKRRHFEEFSYLKIVPKPWEIILLYVMAVLIAVGINFWNITNEFDDEHPKGTGFNHFNRY